MMHANEERERSGTQNLCFLSDGSFFNVMTRLRSIQKINKDHIKPNSIAQPKLPEDSSPLCVKYHAADVPAQKAINAVIRIVAPMAENFLWSVLHFSRISNSAPATVHRNL